jgi:hypothetical protein
MLAGTVVGVIGWCYFVWLNRASLIPIGEYLPPVRYIPDTILDGLLFVLLNAMVAALVGWFLSKRGKAH